MNNFRSGDEVLLEIPAVVVGAAGNLVRVRFNDIEYDAEIGSLIMTKRSIHVGDKVKNGSRSGEVVQTLEDGVFLLRYDGASGADAYGVAAAGVLVHADAEQESAPAPAPAPTVPAPAAATEDASARTPSPTPSGAVRDMAASLTGAISRAPARRAAVDLESLGTTETVRGVGARGEMVLGDDLRLQNGDEN